MVVQANQIAEIVEVQEKIDLREIDGEQFVELFEYLRERTNGFKEFPPELIVEDSRYLLLLRLCLGLSQKEFAEKLGVTKDWTRHTEAGRNKIIHMKIANRYVEKINSLLDQTQVTLNQSIENWKRYQFARDQELPNVKTKIKTILKMNEGDLKIYFDFISNETDGFTKFNHQLLMEVPQSILIFRIVLGVDHRKFARLLGINSRGVRAYEHLEAQMKLKTAIKLAKKIETLFVGKKISFANALENFRWLKGVYGRGKLNSFIERGFKFAEGMLPNALETKVQTLLQNAKLPFEMHARVKGLKRDYNVDFVIPDVQNPKVVIEVVRVRLRLGKKKYYRPPICQVDHRFQMIKAQHPQICTVLVLLCDGVPIDVERVRGMIQIETLNTNMYAVKEEELMDLISRIKLIIPENKKGI